MLRYSKKRAPNDNFGTVRKLTKCTFGCNGIVHSSDFYSHEHSLLFSFYSILTGHLLDLCEFWCEMDFLITPLPRRKIYMLVIVAANGIYIDVRW